MLTLNKEARVRGTVDCFNIEIFGTLEGKINSKGTVLIRPGAYVEGEILCENLVVYPGAIMNIQGKTLDQ